MLRRIAFDARIGLVVALVAGCCALATTVARAQAAPLPSWNAGAAKERIFAFIDAVTREGGKPAGIHKLVGRRPIAAFSNSDGGLPMLDWTTSGSGRRLGAVVHHNDAAREISNDRELRTAASNAVSTWRRPAVGSSSA